MIKNKIYTSIETLKGKVRQWQAQGDKVVFTNGCFDLLHPGHIAYLEEAKNLGSKLVVALNSDQSVSNLKGHHRPINDESSRCTLMAALSMTDAVIVFDAPTPYDTIAVLLPDVLVKGGDWTIDQIIGSDIVLKHGGHVQSLTFIEGFSTTAIEQKILHAHNRDLL